MKWAATADVLRFEEALSWFRGRTILTDEERKRIPTEARQRSFWIAGAAQMSVVEDVFKELDRHIAEGLPLQQFQKTVGKKLAQEWGTADPFRVETILRNAAQSSYNAGRWEQMEEPDVVKYRPFRMFDAVRDERTTEICTKRDRVIRRADDPWWATNVPPLHHRCRSGVRALREAQAKRLGGETAALPDVAAQPGFGLSPELAQEWRPKSAYPELQAALETKIAKLDGKVTVPKAKKKPGKPTPEEPTKPASVPKRDKVEIEDLPNVERPKQLSDEQDKQFFEAAEALREKRREAFGVRQFSGGRYAEIRNAQVATESEWSEKFGPGYDGYRQLALDAQSFIEAHAGTVGTARELFRGISVERSVADSLVKADYLHTDRLTSTSWSLSEAESFSGRESEVRVLFKLRNTSDRSAIPISALSFLPEEREVLLGAGKRYHISKVSKYRNDGKDVVLIEAEEYEGALDGAAVRLEIGNISVH